MFPRPSTTISLKSSTPKPPRSACLTIEPSRSLRISPRPVTRRRPSGGQSIDHPRPGGPSPTTSRRPSRSTATISPVPQCANHRRPSCPRGDSPIARPLSRVVVSSTAGPCADTGLPFLWIVELDRIVLHYETVQYYHDRFADRRAATRCLVRPG